MEQHAATAAARSTVIQHIHDKDIEVARSEKAPSCYREEVVVDEETTSSALDRTVSRITQRTGRSTRSVVIDPDAEPPDGGIHAWLKVYGCFLMYANTMYVYTMLSKCSY
jgi:hypothetical protein